LRVVSKRKRRARFKFLLFFVQAFLTFEFMMKRCREEDAA